MREILFRGKRVDNGDWVYGSYGLKLNAATGEHDEYIMESVYSGTTNSSYFADYKIIPGTAGQYTGMTDKNGNKIFEGDTIELSYEKEWKKHIRTVIFAEEMFILASKNGSGASLGSYDTRVNRPFMEIIGNIHDGI